MVIAQDMDLNAKHYRKNSKLQQSLALGLVRNYKFKDFENILDIGCGDGRITADIADQIPNGKITGIDPSINMIELAKKTFPKSEFPNLDFLLKKAEDLIQYNRYDTIVSFSCLHWVREPEKAIYHICHSLKPNGNILILTYPKESTYYEFLQEALEKFPDYCYASAYNTMLTILDYKDLFQSNGIEIQEFYYQDLIASYNDENAVRSYIKGWLTSFVPLPEYLHDDFLKIAIEKSLDYSIDMNNGMINLPYKALVLKGIRKIVC